MHICLTIKNNCASYVIQHAVQFLHNHLPQGTRFTLTDTDIVRISTFIRNGRQKATSPSSPNSGYSFSMMAMSASSLLSLWGNILAFPVFTETFAMCRPSRPRG
ncbi:hypothetical protein T4B_203 [Trichinella pseudospiralis]|uniref:Uncharacterized protein n=1 Tax=Trichinella pseudospiralis TaxID=6337 RepID=A0A0V1IMF5_TRIPS|nr:hypothetical protein T4B_203 [Trichinella pseudospiralis]KRZ37263.1 hypothetical protein T4C_9220 [Trichinella pseudospiralis]